MIGWRSFTHGTRTLVVKAAEMVFTKGASFARPIAVLDERELQDTLRKAEDALKTPGVLPPGTLDKVAQVVLTSLNHESDVDPTELSTGLLLNTNGVEVGKIHVAKDPAQQQAARMTG